jgi:hypothetical protein
MVDSSATSGLPAACAAATGALRVKPGACKIRNHIEASGSVIRSGTQHRAGPRFTRCSAMALIITVQSGRRC